MAPLDSARVEPTPGVQTVLTSSTHAEPPRTTTIRELRLGADGSSSQPSDGLWPIGSGRIWALVLAAIAVAVLAVWAALRTGRPTPG